MSSPLVILGAVGNCLDILEAVEAINSSLPAVSWEVVGFLDDESSRQGTKIRGVPVLGPLALAREMLEVQFVNGIGSPRSHRDKHLIIDRTGIEPSRFVTVLHPSASISPSVTMGRGCVVLGNSTICANVRFGDHVMVLPNCVFGHDSHVGDHTIFAAGVVVSGSVSIGRSCYLGAGSCIRDGVSIGNESLLGLGAVLVKDAPAGSVMVGNPARQVRSESGNER